MVTVSLVYLKKGEQPPAGEKATIVDCSKGPRTITDSKKAIVFRVPPNEAQDLVGALAEKGVRKIYVRGMPGEPAPPKSKKLPRKLPDDPIARGVAIMREATAEKPKKG